MSPPAKKWPAWISKNGIKNILSSWLSLNRNYWKQAIQGHSAFYSDVIRLPFKREEKKTLACKASASTDERVASKENKNQQTNQQIRLKFNNNTRFNLLLWFQILEINHSIARTDMFFWSSNCYWIQTEAIPRNTRMTSIDLPTNIEGSARVQVWRTS